MLGAVNSVASAYLYSVNSYDVTGSPEQAIQKDNVEKQNTEEFESQKKLLVDKLTITEPNSQVKINLTDRADVKPLTNNDFPNYTEKLNDIENSWKLYREGESEKVNNSSEKSNDIKAETEDCETCESRRYVDVSDDNNVSFQIPTKISKSEAEAKVRAHENEHVVNEQANAQEDGRRVVSQSMTIKTAVCPECGEQYIAGGETVTVTAPNPKTVENADSILPKNENAPIAENVGNENIGTPKDTENVLTAADGNSDFAEFQNLLGVALTN